MLWWLRSASPEPSTEVAAGEPTAAKALPGEWLRRPATWLVTRLFIHDVAAYLYEEGIRGQIEQRLEPLLVPKAGPYALVSHSLGTVISYEVLHRLRDRIEVPVWITLRSPLGIGAVQDHIRQPLVVPTGAAHWLNFADRLDPLALDANRADDFPPGEKIADRRIVNSYRTDVLSGGPHVALKGSIAAPASACSLALLGLAPQPTG